VPGEDGRGLNNDEAGPPAGPQLREPYPEESVPLVEPAATDGSLQHRQLMPEGDILQRTAAELTRRARTKAQTPRTRIITAPGREE
jgi:hypothetical protein